MNGIFSDTGEASDKDDSEDMGDKVSEWKQENFVYIFVLEKFIVKIFMLKRTKITCLSDYPYFKWFRKIRVLQRHICMKKIKWSINALNLFVHLIVLT